MAEATWGKSSSKEKFNQLWQGIKELKETMLIQNKKTGQANKYHTKS